MDSIAESEGFALFFLGIFLFMSFLLIFSCTIWVENKIIYWISYVGLMILVIFLIFSDIDNLKYYSQWETSELKILLRIGIMIVLDIMCVIGSIFNQKKRRIVSNILLNFAAILSVVNFIMLQKVLWH